MIVEFRAWLYAYCQFTGSELESIEVPEPIYDSLVHQSLTYYRSRIVGHHFPNEKYLELDGTRITPKRSPAVSGGSEGGETPRQVYWGPLMGYNFYP